MHPDAHEGRGTHPFLMSLEVIPIQVIESVDTLRSWTLNDLKVHSTCIPSGYLERGSSRREHPSYRSGLLGRAGARDEQSWLASSGSKVACSLADSSQRVASDRSHSIRRASCALVPDRHPTRTCFSPEKGTHP